MDDQFSLYPLPQNQLELDISEFNSENVEGIIEFNGRFEITKRDSFSSNLFDLEKLNAGASRLIASYSYKQLIAALEELSEEESNTNKQICLFIENTLYDILLSKENEQCYCCRIKRRSGRTSAAAAFHGQSSPLKNAGILLWSMDEHEQTIRLQSAPEDFVPSIGRASFHSIFYWINRIHPDDQGLFQSKWETFLNGFIGSFYLRYRIKPDDGEYQMITTIARRARPTADKTLVEISGIHVNDTEITSANDELRILSFLAKKVRLPISITDSEGTSIWTNSTFYNIFGYRNHELRNAPLLRSLAGDNTSNDTLDLHLEKQRLNKTFNLELVCYLSNGKPIWCTVFSKPVLNEGGKAQRYIHFFSDVTEYKKAENAFLQSEVKFRSLFENANDALLIISLRDGEIIELNAAAKSLFDCSSLFGHSVENIVAGDTLISSDKLQESLNEYETLSIRKNIQINPKVRYTLDINFSRIGSSKNTALATIRNVTDELFLEEQLLHSQKMQAVGKLAGGVAHDFNNLLSGIRGFAELIANSDELTGANQIYLKELLKTSDRATKLTSRLLSFSRNRPDTPKVCDLNEIVNNISPMLSRILQQDIHFKITIGQKACHCLVDHSQVEQAIMNLVVNAQEATSGQNRFIELRTYSKEVETEKRYSTGIAKPGDYHILEVTDNGHGMSPEVIERIFEPFFTTKEGAGTGLGLAIAYSIVNKSNGFVHIDSEVGSGTRFSLIFPESKDEIEDQELIEEKINPPLIKSENLQTVLVAEDQESLREILQISLSKVGHKLFIAKDGEEALDLYKAHKDEIDLVLSDSIMPKMNGAELAKRIREMDSSLRIIIMSGLPEEELFKDAEPVRIDSFINKPFSIKDVLNIIEKLLSAEPA
ncbi:response regulator [Puniceicoccaceae bacterium K14]|nr:response regulator [Puniceicoccaceae bacterium K14]